MLLPLLRCATFFIVFVFWFVKLMGLLQSNVYILVFKVYYIKVNAIKSQGGWVCSYWHNYIDMSINTFHLYTI